MPDLEDVLTNLDKFEEKLDEMKEFIGDLKRLFGMWDGLEDVAGAEGEFTLGGLINEINDYLIYKRINE